MVWHSFGHTHVCKPEDFPVMPVEYAGFMLKPNGFFAENPAMDLPPERNSASKDDRDRIRVARDTALDQCSLFCYQRAKNIAGAAAGIAPLVEGALEIRTGRPVTLAPNGMVTSPHSLASAAGVDVLRAGGSAIDAAIAASAVLAVVYPHMTGIGGDAFWLIHDGKTGKVRSLNGGGRAAASAQLSWFAAKGLHEIPFRGIIPATLTVPGAVASWTEAHAAYGRLPLRRALEAAIDYAAG